MGSPYTDPSFIRQTSKLHVKVTQSSSAKKKLVEKFNSYKKYIWVEGYKPCQHVCC